MVRENLNKAIIAVDMQKGFMPAREGLRLHSPDGFGELAVADADQLVAPLSKFLGWAALNSFDTITTQDWHPYETAHFAPEGTEPDYRTTWPRHCVDGTAGAELHPDLVLPKNTIRFIKGTEALEHGEDDLSYSAYYAFDPTTDQTLPEHFKRRGIAEVAITGVAGDYCAGKSAYDFKTKAGLDVYFLTDLIRSVTEPTAAAMMTELESVGVHVMTSVEYQAQIKAGLR